MLTTKDKEQIMDNDSWDKMKQKRDIILSEEFDVEEDISSENKANSVYSSPTLKNNLVISKGSPRKGFRVEDLPSPEEFERDNEPRSTSFKVVLCKSEPLDYIRMTKTSSSKNACFRTNS